MAAALGLTLLSLGSAAPALAREAKGPAAPRLTPAQQAQTFPERRTELLRHHRERISILRNGERCIDAARDSEALRRCMQQERQQQQALRQSHWEAMRGIYERNGIEMPQRGPGGGGGRQRQGGA